MSTNYTGVVEEIKNRLDIVDVISKHVVLKKTGRNYMGLCPFHNEKTPSFTVTPSKQIFKCFGCGEGGDVISFLMKISNLSFVDVVREQAVSLGIELQDKWGENSKEKKEEIIRLKEAVKYAVEFYYNNLQNNDEALSYLEKRGAGEIAVGKFFLGLAPNSNFELKNYLRQKGFTNDELYKAGLLYEKNGEYIDRFKNRIMIPIFDVNSSPVGFGARAVVSGQNPKYLNSPDSIIYNKSAILFGLNNAKEAISKEDSVIIMEGYFDVISAQIAGVKNVVASCGTALTPQHIKLLSRYTASRKIYLAFDADKAGRNATKTGAEVIKEIFKGLGEIKQTDVSYAGSNSQNVCEIRVVEQFGGKDPDEYIREYGGESYMEQIKNAPLLIDYELSELTKNYSKDITPQEKSVLIQQIADILKEIQNPVILSDYVRVLSFKTNVDEMILKNEIKKLQDGSGYYISDNSALFKKTNKNNLIERHAILESKLLQLGMQADTKEKVSKFLDFTSDFNPKNERNSLILTELKEILKSEIDFSNLAKKLFLKFYTDSETSKHLTDLVYASDEYRNMTQDDFVCSIVEIFDRLKKLDKKIQIEKLKSLYNEPNATEEEKIKVQRAIIEQVKK
ncbi:MAG: DNA primase [Candidatus Gastranaerophilales bacterium]|nr:DNA primase [Candidatus Gastranaerophilales bacterium]